MNIKSQHEEGVCRRFLTAYNKVNQTSHQFLKMQIPDAPDCLCSNSLNIEVVTAYYDEAAAKMLNDLVKGKIKAPSDLTWDNDPDKKGADAVDNCISKKSTKSYTWNGKLWLVIDVIAPLAEWEQFEDEYLGTQRGLPAGVFDEIWVLMKDFDGDHVGQVKT